ncbi:Hypothetical predicted protein, partial [Paramuricea clavata]
GSAMVAWLQWLYGCSGCSSGCMVAVVVWLYGCNVVAMVAVVVVGALVVVWLHGCMVAVVGALVAMVASIHNICFSSQIMRLNERLTSNSCNITENFAAKQYTVQYSTVQYMSATDKRWTPPRAFHVRVDRIK